MIKEEKIQHVQIPNDMTLDVKPKDLVIYASIKRHQNKETKQAFPTLTTISVESGASINTVRSCIKNLEEKEYIKVIKKGKKNIYEFSPYKNFEPFSYDFLDKEDLSFEEKSYILASQQYMYKDVEGIGKISMSNEELSNKINISENTIIKYNNSLERKGYLTKIDSELRDFETGCKEQIKIFDLKKLMQSIVWVLKNHEERISNNEETIQNQGKTIELLQRKIEKLEKQLNNKSNFIMN